MAYLLKRSSGPAGETALAPEPKPPTWLCPTEPGAVHPLPPLNSDSYESPSNLNKRLGYCPPAANTPPGEAKRHGRVQSRRKKRAKKTD